VKVVIFIEKCDLKIKWEECSENEKKDIDLALNTQGLKTLGYLQEET